MNETKSRAYTVDEVREHFLETLHNYVRYWDKTVKYANQTERLEGLVFSILNIFDGTSALPAFDLLVSPHENDKAFHIENGDNYYEPKMLINNCHLHEMWYNKKS